MNEGTRTTMSRMTVLLSFLSILHCLYSCSALESESIVGGAEVLPGSVKYHVSLESPLGSSLCGGAIIGDRHVITAAHCVTDRRDNFLEMQMFAVVGTINLDRRNESTIVAVEKAYIPSVFSHKKVQGDIAILRLKEPLGLDRNPKLSKVVLPHPRKTYSGRKAVVTGFGYNWIEVIDQFVGIEPIEYGGKNGENLMFAYADVLSRNQCQQGYKVRVIRHNEICARVRQGKTSAHSGVCSGDSGGPLVFNGKEIIGVVSSSPLGCREDTSAAVYTRVSSFSKFIRDAMNDRTGPTIRQFTF